MKSRRISSSMAGALLLAGVVLSSPSSAQQVPGKVDFGGLQQQYPWLPQLPANDGPLATDMLKGYFALQPSHQKDLLSILTLMEPAPPPKFPPIDRSGWNKREVQQEGIGQGILAMPIDLPRRSKRAIDAAYFAVASHCDPTIETLLSFKDGDGAFPPCVDGTGSCRQAAAEYDSKCLLRPQQTSLGPALSGKIARLTVSIYYHRGITDDGHFDSSAQGPNCSGVLIAPDMLITARHCVVDSDGPSPRLLETWHFSARTTMDPWNDIFFAAYFLNLQIPRDQEAAKSDIADDWIIVKLAKSVDGIGMVELEKPLFDEDLVVSGYSLVSMYGLAQPNAGAAKFSASHDWTDFLRMDDTAACRVLSAPEGGDCIVHGCQTEHGGSGSPLFVYSQSEGLRLVGIQSRFDDGAQHNGGKCSEDARAMKMSPNIAVGVSDDMLEKVKKARGS